MGRHQVDPVHFHILHEPWQVVIYPHIVHIRVQSLHLLHGAQSVLVLLHSVRLNDTMHAWHLTVNHLVGLCRDTALSVIGIILHWCVILHRGVQVFPASLEMPLH